MVKIVYRYGGWRPTWNESGWQHEVNLLVCSAEQKLHEEENVGEVRRYLQHYALTPQTWHAWRLGAMFLEHYHLNWQPVLVIPWITVNDIIQAVQFRFLQASANDIAQVLGGQRILLGRHLWHETNNAVLVCDDELLCIQLWQLLHKQPELPINICASSLREVYEDLRSEYERIHILSKRSKLIDSLPMTRIDALPNLNDLARITGWHDLLRRK